MIHIDMSCNLCHGKGIVRSYEDPEDYEVKEYDEYNRYPEMIEFETIVVPCPVCGWRRMLNKYNLLNIRPLDRPLGPVNWDIVWVVQFFRDIKIHKFIHDLRKYGYNEIRGLTRQKEKEVIEYLRTR